MAQMFNFQSVYRFYNKTSFNLCVALYILSVSSCTLFQNGNRLTNLEGEVNEVVLKTDPFLPNSENVFQAKQSTVDIEQWFATVDELKNEVSTLDTTDLEQSELVRYRILKEYLKTSSERSTYRHHFQLISHLHGKHLDSNTYLEKLTIHNAADANVFLDNLSTLEDQIAGLISSLEQSRENDCILPTFILNKIIKQCDSLVNAGVEESSAFVVFRNKLLGIEALDEKSRDELLAKCSVILEGNITPAYTRLSTYLRQLLQRSMSVPGVWQYPKGDDYYLFSLQLHTGTQVDPNLLYVDAKKELISIEKQISEVETVALPKPSSSASSFSNPPSANGLSLSGLRGFSEALSLYESFARSEEPELGLQVQKLTFLKLNQLATAKLMVDIGIHKKQWLREQAVKFMMEQTGLSTNEATELVDQSVVYPGMHAAEKVVFMRLKRLQAERSAMEFYQYVKSLGSMQLKVLEQTLATENL